MGTTQQHSNIPSTAVEFAPITDVDLALAAQLATDVVEKGKPLLTVTQ